MDKMGRLKSVIQRLKSARGIKIAILFGSQANGRARKDSDVDICIIGDNEEAEMKALEYASEEIDISAFSRLPLYVQYRVFKNGRMIFNKDDKLLTKAKFWTITRYLDEKYWRDKFTKRVLS